MTHNRVRMTNTPVNWTGWVHIGATTDKPTTTYYLAAAFSRRAEIRAYRDELQTKIPNSTVTSRWINNDGKWAQDFTTNTLNNAPHTCAPIAQGDLDDIADANTLILFTGTGRGGRHVEFGYALALDKRLIAIGTREIIFHTLPIVEVYPSWEDFLSHELRADKQ
jgi:nucleoside 2-deoxyribosyltransferase